MVDDDAFSNVHADDQDVSESDKEECQADHSVLDLYEKLFKLRSNPFGLERFSREEKVQIELLQLLWDLNCPLKAFTLVLNWAAKSNASGQVFQEGCQPTCEKVMSNCTCLICRGRSLWYSLMPVKCLHCFFCVLHLSR